MAGRPRKPTAIALLKGLDKRRPSRWARQRRDQEPESLGPLSPTAPDWMDEDEANCYHETVSRCHKDVLCVADSAVVEMVAVLLAEFRGDSKHFSVNKYSKLFSGLDKLGMTPASRSKVQAMKRDQEEANPLNEFAA